MLELTITMYKFICVFLYTLSYQDIDKLMN